MTIFNKSGEEGERGEHGLRGERGPTGDHGQDGLDGERGERGPTNRLAMVGYFILTAFVVFSLFVGYRTDQAIEDQQIKNCLAAQENRDSLRGLLNDAAKRTATSKQRTPEEKAEAKVFYDEALAKLPRLSCPEVIEVGIPRSLGLDFG